MPVGSRFSALVQTGPGVHPASCTMSTGSFLGVKSSRGVTLTPHPLLVPWSRKSRAIPLLPLWAVRPVQNLSACTRVLFNPPPPTLYIPLGRRQDLRSAIKLLWQNYYILFENINHKIFGILGIHILCRTRATDTSTAKTTYGLVVFMLRNSN